MLPEDLEYFLPTQKAAKAFEMLDVDADGKVTLHDIRDAVLNVYRVRSSSCMCPDPCDHRSFNGLAFHMCTLWQGRAGHAEAGGLRLSAVCHSKQIMTMHFDCELVTFSNSPRHWSCTVDDMLLLMMLV